MKQQMTAGLDLKLREMAQRIRELREIVGLTPEQMAGLTDVTAEEYRLCEAGERDLNFAFIYRCAQALGVDVTDIIEGASPRLSNYTLTRAGEGQHIEHANGMTYYNMAARFKKRVAEPLYVVAQYSDEAQLRPIDCTSHSGQECDIVLSGQLKVQVGEHIEILNPGDTIYYNSTAPHGMIATGGRDCVFYAIVLEGDDQVQPLPVPEKKLERRKAPEAADREPRIWEKFLSVEEREDGSLEKIRFKDPDRFNFAFDVVDGLARRKPDKLAMLHVDRSKVERYFTFADMSRYSSKAANYFRALGIRRGDRVLLILRRHYQFWFAILGLHKIGAVALLASNQMMTHDLEYRYEAAGISAVVCTAHGEVSRHAEEAAQNFPDMTRIMVDGCREGWHDFDNEFRLYSDEFIREKDAPCGEDPMLMFFTSGTTGFPKAAVQCCKYPLGHFITAKYWHCVDPEGLHLTISDTGWAKAMWGKLYGQWLNEAAVFVYDFDRFDAADILPKGFACPHCGKSTGFTKEEDTLDGWFDSGSTHFASMKKDQGFWPADVYMEGLDQYRGWFQSSLLTAVGAMGQGAPFKQCVTHGWTVDGEGKAMHKSLGNGVDPADIFKKYGADMIRLWAGSADYHVDVRCSDNIFKQLSQSYLKFRNTARYCLGNLDGFDADQLVSPSDMLELDRWAVTKLNGLIEKCFAAYDNYEFHVVSHAVNDFCVVELSSFYLDIIKDRLYCEEKNSLKRRSAQTALWMILDTITKLFAPILAFTCDEIWQAMPHRAGDDPRNVVLNEMNKPFADYALDDDAMAAWDGLIALRTAVNAALEQARNEKKIGKGLEAMVTIPAGKAAGCRAMSMEELADLLIVSQVEISDTAAQVEVAPAQGEKCQRCWKILPSVGSDSAHPTLCARCAKVVRGMGLVDAADLM